ncbi:MAG TPA: hypothetical protein VH189_13320 [Rhizomicrobium sp.]|jgi:hypothetical protein|nr:hypothetical protein [Rhizomicrobium sp.]
MERFEIRLVDQRPRTPLLFATSLASDSDAVRYARRLLERHPEFYAAEIWKGMKMVRQI